MAGIKKIQRRRRRICFRSLEEIYQDAEWIARSDHVQRLGNWTLGQALEHLAKSFRSSIQESQAKLPLRNRIIAQLGKRIFLRFGLPAGVQLESYSEVLADEFLPEQLLSDKSGLALLRQAIDEISASDMPARHNLFGRMTRRDWLQMHCRHAELHLSFLIPIEPQPTQKPVCPTG